MSEINQSSKCRLPRNVIIKAPGLLPMLYTPREIAEELDLPEKTLRDWLTQGAPHSRDERDHLWVDGRQFAAWVEAQRQIKRQSHGKLKEGEGYCLRCNQIVQIENPVVCHIKGKLYHIKGKCPTCGCTINRGGRYDRTSELPQG